MCIVLCPRGDNIMPRRIHIIAYWFPFCQQSYKFPPIMESSLQRSLEIPTGLSAAVAEQSEQGCAVTHGSALCLIMHSLEITNTEHVCFLFVFVFFLCVCACVLSINGRDSWGTSISILHFTVRMIACLSNRYHLHNPNPAGACFGVTKGKSEMSPTFISELQTSERSGLP